MRNGNLGTLMGVLIALGTTLTTSCGNQGGGHLAAVELSGAAAEIAGLLSAAEQSSSFTSGFAKATGGKIGSLSKTLVDGMSDGEFVFEGLAYKNLKSALTARKANFATLGSLDKTFGSTKNMFAAHGLSGKIKPDELNAFVKVATIGMQSLTKSANGSIVKDRSITTRTLAAAMRVSIALDLLGPKAAKKVALALAGNKDGIPKSSGGFGVCSAYSSEIEKKDWLCFQDNIGGSVGYYADASKGMWQDCCLADRQYKVCDEGHGPSDGGSWGWIPDPSDPTGQKGESCHAPFAVSDKDLKKFCDSTIVAIDSWQCRDQDGDKKEAKASASGGDANAEAGG